MRLVLGLIVVASIVAACTSSQGTVPASVPSAPAASGSSDSLTPVIKGIWATELVPPFVDPHRQTAPPFIHLWKAVAEPLVEQVAGKPGIQPVLAESYDVSDGGRTITFKLRHNVKFQDGTDFNADAVKFNLDRQKALNAGAAYVLANVTQVSVVDPYTVKVTQSQPFTPIIAGLALIGMMSPKSIRDNTVGNDNGVAYTNHNLVGTGPYKLTQYDFPNRIVLDQFPDYWAGWHGNHAKQFIIDIHTTEPQSQLLALRRGDADFVYHVPEDNIAELKADKSFTVLSKPTSTTWVAKLQLEAGPTKDVRVRQALNYLWNFDAYKRAAGGLEEPADGPFSTGLLEPAKPTNPYSYNPAKAKELLDAAGVPKGTKFTWYWFTGVQESRLITEIMQIELQKLGYQLESVEAPFQNVVDAFTNFHKNLNASAIPSASNIFLQPRYADPYSVAYLFYSCDLMGSAAGRNYNYYCNRDVDSLFAQAASTGDAAKAAELYAKAGQLIAADAPDVYIAKRVEERPLRCNVKGWQLHQNYFEYINLYNLYLSSTC